MSRAIRDADAKARRLFDDKAEAERWLGEVLTPFERRRLREFIAEVSA
jgi:hypothetical protein